MDFPLVNEIISNLWLFQTESVVPLFGELSLMILILFVIAKISGIFLDLILNKSNNKIAIGLVLFPIHVVGLYGLLYFFGGYFGLDFQSLNILDIINYALENWWIFLLFWPVVLLKIPFGLIGKKGEGGKNYLVSFIFAPIYEELAFRLLAINTIFLITKSIEISLFLSAIAFALIHLPNMDQGKWVGPSNLWANFKFGIFAGIIAINYGLIFAILFHAVGNLIGRLLGDYL